MKKFLSVIILLINFLFLGLSCSAEDIYTIYSHKNRYGLKDHHGNVILKPVYKKLIKLGDDSWIVKKRGKYGLITSNGKILVPIKYNTAERVEGKYLKVFNNYRTTLFDEKGNIVIAPIYTKIDFLNHDLLRVYKNYKYGVVDINGNSIIARQFDDLYLSSETTFEVKYKNNWYTIEVEKNEPQFITTDEIFDEETAENMEVDAESIAVNIGAVPLYSVVTVTDYGLKPLTTFVSAWSDTVDNLFLTRGADAVETFQSGMWIPLLPYYYGKSYIQNLFKPDQGPLSYPRQTVQKLIR